MDDLTHMCDADVWIKLSYVNRIDILFNDCKMLYISDYVKEEINYIGKNYEVFAKSIDYLRLYLSQKPSPLKAIYFSKFNKDDQMSINNALSQYNITLGKNTRIKNAGEIISAVYADHLNISIIKSDDTEFKNKFIPKEFSHIKVINLKDILHNNLPNEDINYINGQLSEAQRKFDEIKQENHWHNFVSFTNDNAQRSS